MLEGTPEVKIKLEHVAYQMSSSKTICFHGISMLLARVSGQECSSLHKSGNSIPLLSLETHSM